VDSNSQGDDDNCPVQKENFVVWQKSMDLVTESYLLVHRLPQNEQYGLASQMRRAAVSIPANIAEGFGRWHS
jgi:four helix bundle protein